MHKLRYSRSGGWRRDNCCRDECYKGPQCFFGFGGPNQGGFGRYGMYGGYRSFYNYKINEECCNTINDKALFDEKIQYTNLPDMCYMNTAIPIILMFIMLVLLF